MLDPETLSAFLESGPEMLRYFADKTPVRFQAYPAMAQGTTFSRRAKP